jgi:RND family efflux transporter MFP subunit
MLRQDLRIAEVERDRTRYDLERSEVPAPFSGVVVSRAMSEGEYTTAGAALVRLVNDQALEISVNAPLSIARFNQPGQSVQVSAHDDRLQTAIRGVVPVGDEQSRMMELRLALEPGQWHIGEAVTVELPIEPRALALSVPRDALVLRDQQVFVYTVGEDNRAVKVPVTLGAGYGQDIAIESTTLSAGDPVVVRGAERLREGQPLKVILHHLAVAK